MKDKKRWWGNTLRDSPTENGREDLIYRESGRVLLQKGEGEAPTGERLKMLNVGQTLGLLFKWAGF